MTKYDAIIIGSGQGGTPLSKKLAKAGWKTALVERKFIGGTCINVGCTPTKTMIASAHLAYRIENSTKLGINVQSSSVDLTAIIRRKNEIVESFRNGSQSGLEATENLTLIFGEASFIGNKLIEVKLADGSKEELTGEFIFIDTGTTTTISEVEGIETIPYLTSTSILDITEIPNHLLVIGANYIGCEFGQMFQRLGSKVTMLEKSPEFLKREDRDIATCLSDILQEDGITIYKSATLKNISTIDDKIITVVDVAGEQKEISCSHVLLAAGRTPNTKALKLENTGVATDDKGYITVNEKLETSCPYIYAIGDVKGGPAFTHISYNDYIVIAKNLLEEKDVSITGRPVPYCMFTDPQLGRIGLSEDMARKKGLNFKTAKLSMANVARAIETGETKGLIKAIVDVETKQVLGAAVIGEQGGEIMTMLQLVMEGNITYDKLADMIFAHPLYGESINNLFMQLD